MASRRALTATRDAGPSFARGKIDLRSLALLTSRVNKLVTRSLGRLEQAMRGPAVMMSALLNALRRISYIVCRYSWPRTASATKSCA